MARAVRAVWTEGEVQLAIRELSDADLLRLRQTARMLGRGCHLAPEELLSEAIGRFLEGARKVPRSEQFMAVMMGAMRSIASNDRKRHDNTRVDAGDDETLNGIGDSQPTPEDELVRKNLRAGVLAVFEGDAVAQTVCEGWFFEQMSDKELAELTDLGAKELATKKTAIKRKLIKSGVGAHLR